jgi:DNA-binding transcriptional LysR family regulator
MDLWQLHIFCKVVELGSFSRAGKAVHLSQPTVSSHIQALEEHVGCRLVDRLSKETVPTRAGELLHGYAKKLLALRDEAESALAEFQGKISGRLVIGGSTIPGGYVLPEIIGDFTRIYPGVTISLVVGDTEKMIQDTATGELELSVVGARASHAQVVQEKFLDDRMRLVVSPGHPWARKRNISLSMLRREPFIAREPGSGTLKSIQESLTRAGIDSEDLNIIAEMGSTQAVIQGIKAGLGVSILSTIAVAGAMRAGTLKALSVDGIALERAFYLTRHKHRSLSPLGRAFIDFLKNR